MIQGLRGTAWALACAVCLIASAAPAQDEVPTEPRPERLYLNSGALLGAARVVGLGGAYVGVAEGTGGFASNLTALAQRSPTLERDWDIGITLSALDLPFTGTQSRDLDNDGRADETVNSRQLLGALMLQYKRFGVGFLWRNSSAGYCINVGCRNQGDKLSVSLSQSALAGSIAFGQDDFILALGIFSAEASFSEQGDESWLYGDSGVAVDMLFRPHGRPYRIGVVVRPEVVAGWRPAEGQGAVIAGRQIYSAVVSPALLSIGASWRLGEGAHRYNRLSPAARRQLLVDGDDLPVPDEGPRDAPSGRWLLTAQVDLISSVSNAVAARSLASAEEPQHVGDSTAFQPRLGAEWDTFPGRLRLRGGTWLEASPFAGRNLRPHLTGGFELFVLSYWEDWSVSASFDLASRYTNWGVSIGFWR
ncbi:hypothetical protein D7Y13_39170 [Corallococcus praedator]|uniref:DUF5723 domain-containing protein n=1 Tax=Corallococcus praedator TaxID=2316724 RepID=A0ABX9Q4Q7_9BACT|nr:MULTISPECIES: hypothetical protein [Corallococcus]RKH13142.1 hypothetical protein D7X74_22430 [Corallococcus sp. CA047B]RKH27119.1 hypothetical protein D7X75_26980 [Corallococcus sp. CA031C]RKH91034.1 hypothetical protein D7Y13_39170 [Corallococcus praedator]